MAFNLINFKKGTLAGLNTLKQGNGVEEGTFYLTIDEAKQTSRLFIGTGQSTALPVNSDIHIYTTLEELSAANAATPFNDGDFAYVSSKNILAVKIGNEWKQINAPDSRAIKDLTPSITTANGVATVQWALRDQTDTSIKEADGQTIPSISMEGANGVSVSSSGKALTITGTSYEMGSAAVVADSDTAVIKLQSKASASATAVDVGSVTVSGGQNVHITGTANNIAIAAEDTKLLSAAGAAEAQGFSVKVKDDSQTEVTATIDPKITLGTHTAAADEVHFVNGVANLNVYTKDEIDSMNKSLDALKYKGTVGTGGSYADDVEGITASGKPALEVGDTFKLVGASTDSYTVPTSGGNSVTAHGGDLIIANGTEGADGKITSTSLFYDVVPSGDEVFAFKGLGANNTGNGIQIEDGASTVLASMEVAAGNQIAVSSTHTGTNGEKAVVTVAHGSISNATNGDASTGTKDSQSAHASKTFNVVTGLTTNNGHVTATQITPIEVVDTVSKLDLTNTAVAVSAANNVATVSETIALVDEADVAVNSKALTFTLGSDNLQITASGNAITANYVWGTF